MRRLVAYLMAGALVASTLMPGLAAAQEPLTFEAPAPLQNRDLTPYVVGLGAVMGVIAFNIAAPTVASWWSAARWSVGNVAAVTQAAQRQLVARVASGAAAGAEAVTASSASASAVASGSAAVSGAASAATRPLVPPLTETMLAQAQIGGVAAGGAGAWIAREVYFLFNRPGKTPR